MAAMDIATDHTELCVKGDLGGCLHEKCTEDACAVPRVPLESDMFVLCSTLDGDQDEHHHAFECGHELVIHGDHVDFLVDGQLHHPHGTHCDLHMLSSPGGPVADATTAFQQSVTIESSLFHTECTEPVAPQSADDPDHHHFLQCGHELVIHDGHLDYLVDGQLHHPHDGDHYDWHGYLDFDADLTAGLSLQPLQMTEESLTSTSLADSDVSLCSCPESVIKDISSVTVIDANCSVCEKKKYRTVVTKELPIIDDPQLHYQRLVKQKYLANFSSRLPVHVLKGVTSETAVKLSALCLSSFQKKCDTIRDFAALQDKQIQTIKERAPQLFRNLKSFRHSAQLLVQIENNAHHQTKRQKNAACCAKFREKKKEKISLLQQTLNDMTLKCEELNERVKSLEEEKAGLLQLASMNGLVVPIS